MVKENTLYSKVVTITAAYLGPAADRFISRQIRNHLNIEPSEIRAADLQQLIDWIKLAMSMLTSDTKVVEEYTDQLNRLAKVGKTRN